MRVVRYRHRVNNHRKYTEQVHLAIVGEPGRKFTPAVMIGFPIRRYKLANEEVERYATEIQGEPVKRTARAMLAAGERMGITKGATRLLKEALS